MIKITPWKDTGKFWNFEDIKEHLMPCHLFLHSNMMHTKYKHGTQRIFFQSTKQAVMIGSTKAKRNPNLKMDSLYSDQLRPQKDPECLLKLQRKRQAASSSTLCTNTGSYLTQFKLNYQRLLGLLLRLSEVY